PEHDLVVALHIDRDDLRRAPVGEPQTALVPARLLAERDPLHEHVRLSHRRLLVLKRIPWLPRWHRPSAASQEKARKKPGRRPAVPTTRRHLNPPISGRLDSCFTRAWAADYKSAALAAQDSYGRLPRCGELMAEQCGGLPGAHEACRGPGRDLDV